VPLRQFVWSFPFEVSLLAATKPGVLHALARIHAEELARHYKSAAKERGQTGELHAGAVTFVQRFDSSLNVHVHLHTCALDGVYVEGDGEALRFVAAAPPTWTSSPALAAPAGSRSAPSSSTRSSRGRSSTPYRPPRARRPLRAPPSPRASLVGDEPAFA
jgi:hypothetical protein